MEIVNTYTQSLPAVRFIGKKYGDDDRVNGGFGAAWQQYIANNFEQTIIEAAGGVEACHSLYEDGNACLGFMRYKEGEPFQYWIGMFTPATTPVPEGFNFVDIPAAKLGICWFKGQESDIYGKEDRAMQKLEQLGYRLITDEQGGLWFFERYSPTRFNTTDDQGNVILDIGFIIG